MSKYKIIGGDDDEFFHKLHTIKIVPIHSG